MSANSLFLPHKVLYHIAVAKCYMYVIHNFMWEKKRVGRHSPKYLDLKVKLLCNSIFIKESIFSVPRYELTFFNYSMKPFPRSGTLGTYLGFTLGDHNCSYDIKRKWCYRSKHATSGPCAKMRKGFFSPGFCHLFVCWEVYCAEYYRQPLSWNVAFPQSG